MLLEILFAFQHSLQHCFDVVAYLVFDIKRMSLVATLCLQFDVLIDLMDHAFDLSHEFYLCILMILEFLNSVLKQVIREHNVMHDCFKQVDIQFSCVDYRLLEDFGAPRQTLCFAVKHIGAEADM